MLHVADKTRGLPAIQTQAKINGGFIMSEESGMDFYVCGGIVFYIPSDCIIDDGEDAEEGVVKATDAFTVQPNFVTAGNMGHVINMITEFKDVSLIFNGYGEVPKNSEIIKGIRQLRSGVKLVS